MVKRRTATAMPPQSEWHITAELRTPKGDVVARAEGLRWSGAWARDSHHAALGHAFKVFLNTGLARAGLKTVPVP